MAKQRRATKNEVDKRILVIQGWIIEGAQDYFIKNQACQKWEISTKQAERYIQRAYERWRQDASISLEDRRAAKIAELKQMKRGMQEKYKGTPAGMNAVTRIEKMIIKLEALEPPRRHQIEGSLEHTHTVETREERDAYIKKVEEKIKANVDN